MIDLMVDRTIDLDEYLEARGWEFVAGEHRWRYGKLGSLVPFQLAVEIQLERDGVVLPMAEETP